MKIAQLLRRVNVLIPAAAATTARTATIDCQGAHNAVFCVHLGAEANTNSTNVRVTLAEADTTSGPFVTWDTALSSVLLDNTAAVVGSYNVPLQGRRRILQLTMMPDTTTNGAVVSAATVEFDDQVR